MKETENKTNVTPEQITTLSKHLIEYIYIQLKPLGVDIAQYLDAIDRPVEAMGFEEGLREFLEAVCFSEDCE